MNLKHAFAFLLLICIGSIPLKLRAVGIEFNHGSWAEIVSKAKAENKLIFIDFYTQWCGPCLNMAQNVFTQPEVGEFYNQNFVNAKIDAEHGEGRDLAKKYKIRFYPSYVFVDPATCEAVHFSSSRQTAEEFIGTGQSALMPARRSFYLYDEYQKGNRDRQLLKDYIEYNATIYQTDAVKKAFDELIAGGAKLTEPDIWKLYCRTITGMDNKYIKEVSDNYAQYCKLFGKDQVDAKLCKETTHGDVATLDSLCDFEGKSFNRTFILIDDELREKKYEEAAARIDAMIADSTVNQQQVIERLKFICRLTPYNINKIPDFWFNKCVEYLQYIAYNQYDRDDALIHQSYAAVLEEVLRRQTDKSHVPACILSAPKYGKKTYSMRSNELKPKPKMKH